MKVLQKNVRNVNVLHPIVKNIFEVNDLNLVAINRVVLEIFVVEVKKILKV